MSKDDQLAMLGPLAAAFPARKPKVRKTVNVGELIKQKQLEKEAAAAGNAVAQAATESPDSKLPEAPIVKFSDSYFTATEKDAEKLAEEPKEQIVVEAAKEEKIDEEPKPVMAP